MIEKTLAEIVRKEPALVREPRRVEAFLKDLCPTAAKETKVLVLLARESIPLKLKDLAPEVVTVTLDRLTAGLVDGLGLNDTTARWGVETWARALGLAFQETRFQAPPKNRLKQFQDAVKSYAAKGNISDFELEALVALRQKLGITKEVFDRVLREEIEFARVLLDPMALAEGRAPSVPASPPQARPAVSTADSLPSESIRSAGGSKSDRPDLFPGPHFQDCCDFERARAFFDRLLQSTPDHYLGLVGLGRALAGLKNQSGALEALQKAISLKPREPEALAVRVGILIQQDQLDLALADLDQWVNLDPLSAAPLFRRGQVNMARDEIGPAISDFGVALDRLPDCPEILLWRARAYSRQKFFNNAESDLEKILALRPGNKEAVAELEKVREKRNRSGLSGLLQDLIFG